MPYTMLKHISLYQYTTNTLHNAETHITYALHNAERYSKSRLYGNCSRVCVTYSWSLVHTVGLWCIQACLPANLSWLRARLRLSMMSTCVTTLAPLRSRTNMAAPSQARSSTPSRVSRLRSRLRQVWMRLGGGWGGRGAEGEGVCVARQHQLCV